MSLKFKSDIYQTPLMCRDIWCTPKYLALAVFSACQSFHEKIIFGNLTAFRDSVTGSRLIAMYCPDRFIDKVTQPWPCPSAT